MIQPVSSLRLPNGAHLFTDAANQVILFLEQRFPSVAWSISRTDDSRKTEVLLIPQSRDARNRRLVALPRQLHCTSDANDCLPELRPSAHRGEPVQNRFRKRTPTVEVLLTDDRGASFGWLRGIAASTADEELQFDQALIDLLGSLLSNQLELSRGIDRERRNIGLLEAMTQTDELTGIINRRGWNQIISDAQERVNAFGDTVAIAVIDLNDLKNVNDLYGHAAGDRLLRRTAKALMSEANASSRVARTGGDEFMILSNNIPSDHLATHFGGFGRALAALGISAAMGHAEAIAGRGSLGKCIEQADRLMYSDKKMTKFG